MLLSRHLTPAPIDEVARITRRGMASWAIPDSPHRCGECQFWNNNGATATSPPPTFGTPAPRRCAKYFTLTNKRGAAVPHNARSCRFFEKLA
jgi:hypothetical protein